MLRRRILITTAGLALLAVLMCADVKAQYVPYYQPGTTRYQSPPISPYLNLLRGRNSAVNYFLGVQTEVDRRLALQQLVGEERRTEMLRDLTGEELYPKLAGTGHPAVFMNYGSYYTFGNRPPLAGQPYQSAPPGQKR